MKKPVHIVLAEDDDDDVELIRHAFQNAHLLNPVHRVRDGEELMDFLRRRGAYAAAEALPSPLLVLLDLRMPRKGGLEALKEIKADARLKHIPVVVLTTSKEDQDIDRAYELGSNSYIMKPVGIEQLLKIVQAFKNYWLEVVVLPPHGHPAAA